MTMAETEMDDHLAIKKIREAREDVLRKRDAFRAAATAFREARNHYDRVIAGETKTMPLFESKGGSKAKPAAKPRTRPPKTKQRQQRDLTADETAAIAHGQPAATIGEPSGALHGVTSPSGGKLSAERYELDRHGETFWGIFTDKQTAIPVCYFLATERRVELEVRYNYPKGRYQLCKSLPRNIRAIDGTIDGLPLLALSEFGLDLRLLPRESNRHAPIASLPVTLQNPHLIESSGMWTEEQTAAVRAAIRKLLLYVDSPEPPQGRPKRPRRPKAT